MMLLRRILRRSKRAVRDILMARRRDVLRSRPRLPRPVIALDGLPSHSASCWSWLIPMTRPLPPSAMLAHAARARCVICVTDGAPCKAQFRPRGRVRAIGWITPPRAIAKRKPRLLLLGREIAPMSNLGIADQEAAFDLVPAARYLASRIRSGFSHIVTHAYEGGHPDHDSAAFCVHAACALIAKQAACRRSVVEAPLYVTRRREFSSTIYLSRMPMPVRPPPSSFRLPSRISSAGCSIVMSPSARSFPRLMGRKKNSASRRAIIFPRRRIPAMSATINIWSKVHRVGLAPACLARQARTGCVGRSGLNARPARANPGVPAPGGTGFGPGARRPNHKPSIASG